MRGCEKGRKQGRQGGWEGGGELRTLALDSLVKTQNACQHVYAVFVDYDEGGKLTSNVGRAKGGREEVSGSTVILAMRSSLSAFGRTLALDSLVETFNACQHVYVVFLDITEGGELIRMCA